MLSSQQLRLQRFHLVRHRDECTPPNIDLWWTEWNAEGRFKAPTVTIQPFLYGSNVTITYYALLTRQETQQ